MSDADSTFTELFNTYYESLIKYCISVGARPHDAEDAVAEAFSRAFSKSDQLMTLTPRQQKAWLYTAATKIIKEKRSKKTHITFSEINNIEDYLRDGDEIEKFHSEESFDSYVKEVYSSLSSDRERELFDLIFDKKIDYAMMSEQYGIESASVRVMVSRLRCKLREIVNKMLIK